MAISGSVISLTAIVGSLSRPPPRPIRSIKDDGRRKRPKLPGKLIDIRQGGEVLCHERLPFPLERGLAYYRHHRRPYHPGIQELTAAQTFPITVAPITDLAVSEFNEIGSGAPDTPCAARYSVVVSLLAAIITASGRLPIRIFCPSRIIRLSCSRIPWVSGAIHGGKNPIEIRARLGR